MATKELRLVLTVKDFDRATAFFRDALGLPQVAGWENDGGHAVLFDAGRPTLEIFDEAQARAIDQIEVGQRVAGPVRVAFKWRTANRPPGIWPPRCEDSRRSGPHSGGDRNVRVTGLDGIQLTLFASVQ